MTIDKIDPVFAENGSVDTEAAFVAWAGNGYVDERVRYNGLNKVLNRSDSRINKILDRGPKRPMPGATEQQLLTQIWPSGSCPFDSISKIDSGGTPDHYDMAIAIINGERKIIAVDSETALTLDIYNIEDLSYEGTQVVSSSALPSPDGGEQWLPYAIVCDSENAYIIFEQDNSGAATTYQNYQIQAFNLSTWDVVAGWPSTGTLLYNTSSSTRGDLIHANDSLLAAATPALSISASTDPAVRLISKLDGSISSSGAGDQSSGTSSNRIASNGTYIFTAKGNSIDISTPSSGCGGSNWPRSVTGQDVACIGGLVVITTLSGSDIFYVLHEDNALIGTATTGDASICESLGRIVTDGLFFWAIGAKTIGSTNRMTLFRIDPYTFTNENGSTVETGDETSVTSVGFYITAGAAAPDESDPPLVFDGESIWASITELEDGTIYRIPRINLR